MGVLLLPVEVPLLATMTVVAIREGSESLCQ